MSFMVKRMVLAAVCLAWLVPASAIAGEQATLILKSGERISGDLTDLNASGFHITVNGQDRAVPQNDVATIEFGGAAPAAAAQRVASGQPAAITKSGDVVDGRLTDIGGTSPLRLTFQTSSGERNMTSAEVSRVVLAASGNAAAGGQAVGTVGQGGARSYNIPANQQWTQTDLMVREGETLRLRVDGQISFAPNNNANAGGAPGGTRGTGTPIPSAPQAALIGRIDEGQPFIIGRQTSVRMPASGRLWLGINDDVVSDNSGEFRVLIGQSR
jgi:hypothetical protein